jgi:hypothetical protein
MCNITCLLCCIVPTPKHHTVNTFRDVELKFPPLCSRERSASVKVLLDLGTIKKSQTLPGIEFLMSTPKVEISYEFNSKLLAVLAFGIL